MVKRRASVRGRGAEILLGGTSGSLAPPVPPEREAAADQGGEMEAPMERVIQQPPARPKEAPADPDPDLILDDAELERLLEEEALAGAPVPAQRASLAAGKRPVLSQDRPWPQGYGPARMTPEEVAVLYEPPPPGTADLVAGVLPPRPGQMGLGLTEDGVEAYDIQEPDDKVEPIELPDRQLTPEEKAQIMERLGEERFRAMEEAIDEAYDEVRSTVGNSPEVATECYNMLLKARDIVVRGDVAKLAQSEYYVQLVRARVQRALASDKAARRLQWPILLWALIWFIGFLALLILLNEQWFWDTVLPLVFSNDLMEMEVFFSTMLWGGIGGVVAVLYSLFKHVARRDFDVHYSLSYVAKPFLGLILGATVFMLSNVLLRTLGIAPDGLEGMQELTEPTVAPGVMYLLAWAVGFKENRIFDLIDRPMRRLFSGSDGTTPLPPSDWG